MKRMRWAVLLALLVLIVAAFTLLRFDPPAQPLANPTERLNLNVRQGRLMQALYQVQATAEQTAWTPQLHWQAGDLWAQAGDLTRSLPHWEAAALEIGDPALLQKLADGYVQTQRWTSASETLQQLLTIDPDNQWAHYHLGLIRAAFDSSAARQHLQIAARVPDFGEVSAAVLTALDGDESLLAMNVGLALAGAELWPYAELAFQHAADTDFPFAEAQAYVGIARDWQGKDGGAAIEQAVALDARSPIVHYLQGLHLRFAQDYRASLNALVQAVALDPLNPAFYTELGTAYQLADDVASAERWLKMAVEISDDPRFAAALEQFYAESAQ